MLDVPQFIDVFERGGILIYFILFASLLAYHLIFLSTLKVKSLRTDSKTIHSNYLRAEILSCLQLISTLLYCIPLLGLLGTVHGMTGGFLAIAENNETYKQLAKYISQALITTELALLAALPGLILHRILKRQYNSFFILQSRHRKTYGI